MARGLVRDEATADDLVQDAVGVVVARRAPIGDLRAFLAGTVRRLASRSWRSETRRQHREAAVAKPGDAELPGVDELAEQIDTLRVVMEELRGLPPAQQRVVSLCYLESLDAAEIARREGTSPSTVRAHLARGLQTLRDRLDRRSGSRGAWCAVLGPFAGVEVVLTATSGTATSASLTSSTSATSAASGIVGAVGAAGVAAVMLKPLTLIAIPAVLAGAWYLDSDRRAAATEVAGSNDRIGAAAELQLDSDHASQTISGAPTRTASALTNATAAESSLARVEGSVVDALTGEPVPYLDLVLVQGQPTQEGTFPSVSVRTDLHGHFDDPFAELRAGKVEVLVLDSHGGSLARPQQEKLTFPFEAPIEARVGPTFRLELPESDPRSTGFQTVRYIVDDDRLPQSSLLAQVRHNEGPWVRFSTQVLDLEGHGPWALEITNGSGTRRGTTNVHRKSGIEPQAIRFEFDDLGAIEFELSTTGRDSVAHAHVDVWSSEERAGESSRVVLDPVQDTDERLGVLEFLAPGRYSWSFGSGPNEFRDQVDVFGGETTTVRLDPHGLGRLFSTHVLIDASEVSDLDPSHWNGFVVNEADASIYFPATPIRHEDDPEGFLRIEFEGLAEGHWTVGMQPGDAFEVTPKNVSIGHDLPIPTVRVQPAASRVDVRLSVLDAVTGEPLERAEAFYVLGVTETGNFDTDERPILGPKSFPANQEATLFVRAPGYRAQVVLLLPSRDGERVEVLLDKGWANRVIVIDPRTMDLLEGVPVRVDGVHVGDTNERGMYWIEGEGPPKTIEVGIEDPSLTGPGRPIEGSIAPGRDPLKGWVFAASRR